MAIGFVNKAATEAGMEVIHGFNNMDFLYALGEREESRMKQGVKWVWKGSRDQIMAGFEAYIKDNGLYLKEVEGQDSILSDGKERDR